MVTIPTFHLDPFYALHSQYIGVVLTENRGCNGISSFPILHLQDYARANSQGDSKLAASSKQNINICIEITGLLPGCFYHLVKCNGMLGPKNKCVHTAK